MKQSTIIDFFPIRKGFPIETERIVKQVYSAQLLLGRHSYCDDNCLDFRNIIIKDQMFLKSRKQCKPLPLDECFPLVCSLSEKHDIKKKSKQKKRKTIKRKVIKKSQPLTRNQRKEISFYQRKGLKNAAIAFMLRVTPGQVRMNKTVIMKAQLKEEILFTDEQKSWLKKECSESHNSETFTAAMLLRKFQSKFQINQLGVYQFRRMLRSQKIFYRVPSLKPFHFFKKQSRVEELHRFISEICGYLLNNYKLIFIDNCSIGSISRQAHKQWYLQGTFKQSLERIGSNTFIIAAMGENNFLYYQVIEGTGKAFIFKHFCTNLLTKAEQHYKSDNFVLVMDNATIHKNELMAPLLNQIPHVFTPPYRPDMNGIEHLFAWIKRYIVKEQPTLFGAFQQATHKAFSQVDSVLIESWTESIYKHMKNELQQKYNS